MESNCKLILSINHAVIIGSIRILRASGLFLTICLWTWLLAGTSITMSPERIVWQLRRQPGFSPFRCLNLISGFVRLPRLAVELEIPCFANSPSATVIWHRPQIPRPPQTESISTPSFRAHWSRGVPIGNFPRFPEGVKITNASDMVSTLSCWPFFSLGLSKKLLRKSGRFASIFVRVVQKVQSKLSVQN